MRLYTVNIARTLPPRSRYVLVIVAFIAFVFANNSVAVEEGMDDVQATFRVTASELEVDEGSVVHFFVEDKEYHAPITRSVMKFDADLSPVEWDFGTTRQGGPARGYGLYNIKHWFPDDSDDSVYRVTATHQGTTESVNVVVRDVKPALQMFAVTKNPLVGKPVVFQAAVRDPGYNDSIRLSWDFGDGATATGNKAIHTYSQEGAYPVTLTIEDENEAHSMQSLNTRISVRATPEELAPNILTFAGDFSGRSQIESLTLVGATASVTDPSPDQGCQVRVELRSDHLDMSVVLTAHLTPGFAPGHYTIGKTNEWDGSHKQDVSSPGTFFAEFKPPEDKVSRDMPNGMRIGGPFWSDRGRVTINRFSGGMLELEFEAEFTENIARPYTPRTVTARGALSTPLTIAEPVGASGGEILEQQIPGVNELGQALFGMFAGGSAMETPSNRRISAYRCGGEEGETFEIVDSQPEANDVNFPFDQQAVTVTFSQSVDPDSIVNPDNQRDNLLLGVRADNGQLARIDGTWMASQRNPKVVGFVPLSRLMPGARYCVYINGGEKGLRSFTGNQLAGSALAQPTDQMAAACDAASGEQELFTFATRVELESIIVDWYQGSLLGNYAKFSFAPDFGAATARVMPWWRNATSRLHPGSAITEFDAQLFAVANSERLLAGQGEAAGGNSQRRVVKTKVKRPDLYSDAEKVARKHTVEFVFSPATSPGTFDYFAAVQPLGKNGQPVEPLESSVQAQMETAAPLRLDIRSVKVLIECAPGPHQGRCNAMNRLDSPTAGGAPLTLAYLNLPPAKIHSTWLEEVKVEVPHNCAAVADGGECRIATMGNSAKTALLRTMVEQIATNSDADGARIIFASVPSELLTSLLPAAGAQRDGAPHELLAAAYSGKTVILFDPERVTQLSLARRVVQDLLDYPSCFGTPAQASGFCLAAPVQGLVRPGVLGLVPINKHYHEGNEHGGPLFPLLSDEAAEPAAHGLDWRNFHISAQHYAELYYILQGDE